MSWTEITDEDHARQCIQRWFGDVPYLDRYARLAAWLSNVAPYVGSFEQRVEGLSKILWRVYLDHAKGSNRLTQSIQIVGSDFGFKAFVANNLDHHTVYFDTIKAETFINNLIDGVLWKDSFAIHHGEFSHSYQWLAAGLEFGWNQATAELFGGTGRIKSREPIPHMTAGGTVVAETVYLWEWLVDSLNAKDKAKVAHAIGNGELKTLNGHCFTDTYRHANNVHALLLQHKDDWFLGHYASRRNARLMDITARFEQEDFQLLKQQGVSKGKFGGAPAFTKAAVTKNYRAWEERKQGKVAADEGIYRGKLRLGAEKPGPFRIFDFHGILGAAPDTYVAKFEKK